jgi:hypothetical protein
MGAISLIKTSKKYEDFVYKAGTYEFLFLRKKGCSDYDLAINLS